MSTEKALQQINATIKKISAALPMPYLLAIGATNVQVCSTRSIRFDLPAGREGKDGINRIKITLETSGEFQLRTYRLEEVDAVPNVAPDFLQTAIKNLAGIAPAAK